MSEPSLEQAAAEQLRQAGFFVEREVRRAIRSFIGDGNWRPLAPPERNVDRMHKRTVKGTRQDGSRFEVLLERGLDFIIERGRGNRSTRESYLFVRDPME
jgi:hypothetical protein